MPTDELKVRGSVEKCTARRSAERVQTRRSLEGEAVIQDWSAHMEEGGMLSLLPASDR